LRNNYHKNKAKLYEIPNKAHVYIQEEIKILFWKVKKRNRYVLNKKQEINQLEMNVELIDSYGMKKVCTLEKNKQLEYYLLERFDSIYLYHMSKSEIRVGYTQKDELKVIGVKKTKNLKKGDMIKITLDEKSNLYKVYRNNLELIDGALELEIVQHYYDVSYHQIGDKIYVDPNKNIEIYKIIECNPYKENIQE